jgi:hypothetical protein
LPDFNAVSQMTTEQLINFASLMGSGFATILTAYFWLVRSQRERPDLRFFLAAPLDANLSRARSGADGRVDCGVFVKCVVANYSMLPDTLIKVRAKLLGRDGQWITCHVSTEEHTSLPINVPGMHSTLMQLILQFEAPGELSGSTTASRRETALDQLASPPRIQVELWGLSDKAHTHEAEASRQAIE